MTIFVWTITFFEYRILFELIKLTLFLYPELSQSLHVSNCNMIIILAICWKNILNTDKPQSRGVVAFCGIEGAFAVYTHCQSPTVSIYSSCAAIRINWTCQLVYSLCASGQIGIVKTNGPTFTSLVLHSGHYFCVTGTNLCLSYPLSWNLLQRNTIWKSVKFC